MASLCCFFVFYIKYLFAPGNSLPSQGRAATTSFPNAWQRIDTASTLCYSVVVVSRAAYSLYKVAQGKGASILEQLTEMLKGVLEGCVLEIIRRKETYGYEITRQLNALGFTDVVEGTVYTILIRLEKNKLVETVKKPSDMGPPRKFFSLNDAGQAELQNFWAKWGFVASKLEQLKEESNDGKIVS